MADYRSRWNEYGDEANRGSFGYEGEGYLHGGGRDMDDRDWRDTASGRWGTGRGGYGRDVNRSMEMNRGWRGGESWRSRDRGMTGMSGDFSGGTFGQTYGTDRSQQSFRGRGPKNYHRSDERIREDVCERLADDERLDASEIEVNVHESVVTLSGMVDDRMSKRRAEDIAESCNGVHDVQNQIRLSRERGETRNENGQQQSR